MACVVKIALATPVLGSTARYADSASARLELYLGQMAGVHNHFIREQMAELEKDQQQAMVDFEEAMQRQRGGAGQQGQQGQHQGQLRGSGRGLGVVSFGEELLDPDDHANNSPLVPTGGSPGPQQQASPPSQPAPFTVLGSLMEAGAPGSSGDTRNSRANNQPLAFQDQMEQRKASLSARITSIRHGTRVGQTNPAIARMHKIKQQHSQQPQPVLSVAQHRAAALPAPVRSPPAPNSQSPPLPSDGSPALSPPPTFTPSPLGPDSGVVRSPDPTLTDPAAAGIPARVQQPAYRPPSSNEKIKMLKDMLGRLEGIQGRLQATETDLSRTMH